MIQFKKATFTYRNDERRSGVFNVDLTIAEGEFVLLCGESGCGKTTLTRLVNGLAPEYYPGDLQGDVIVAGEKIGETSIQKLSKKVGSVFQNPRSQFFNVDSTSEIAFGMENRGMARQEMYERIGRTADLLHIHHLLDKSLFAMSGGEKQKIACASTSVIDPDILVLDEPSSNLDIKSIRDLKQILQQWKAQGKTILIAEHRLYYLMDLADRVIYLENGNIAGDYPIEDFRKIPESTLHQMGLRSSRLPTFQANRSDDDQPSMTLENVRFSYGKKETLHIDRLVLPQNRIIGILGKNGAGKSTFAHCLCGLAKKAKGTLWMNQKTYDAKARLACSYMVMQDVNHQLFTESVADEIRLSLPPEQEDDERIAEILDQFNLLPYQDLHPMSLSGGQKQRVALASAVASGGDILILDEPTSGLDYRNMLSVSRSLQSMTDTSIFIITHDPELIKACCTYFIFIENGTVLWHGGPTEENTAKIDAFFTVADQTARQAVQNQYGESLHSHFD